MRGDSGWREGLAWGLKGLLRLKVTEGLGKKISTPLLEANRLLPSSFSSAYYHPICVEPNNTFPSHPHTSSILLFFFFGLKENPSHRLIL